MFLLAHFEYSLTKRFVTSNVDKASTNFSEVIEPDSFYLTINEISSPQNWHVGGQN